MEVGLILDKYEELTGRHTMRAAEVQGISLPLKSNGKMTRNQAVEFIKAYLLLNSISIVPSDVPETDKVLMIQQRLPTIEQGEGVRAVYTDPSELPLADKVINYVMRFENISPDEAARSMQLVLQGHPYAKLTPVAQAGALIITDNVPVVRLAIALKEKIDVPSARVVKKFFQLERADAEDVATVITDILAAQTKLRSQQSGASRAVPVSAAAQQLAAPPGINPQTNMPVPPTGQPGGQPGGTQPPDESTVIVKAITRTNEVLVSGRPTDITYIEDLIRELDKEAKVKNLHSFQLRFIRVEDFLVVAQDAISRGVEEIQGSGGSGGAPGAPGAAGAGTRTGARTQQGGAGFQGSPEFGGGRTFFANQQQGGRGRTSQSGLGGAGGVGGGGLNRGRSSASGGNVAELIPSSIVVGKTLLISEPRSNTLLVAGPPEHIDRIEEVIAEMDKRPWQVSIAVIVAEISLGDDYEYGIDILRKAENIVAGGQNVNWAGAFRNLTSGSGIIDPNLLTSVQGFEDAGATSNGLNLYGSVGEYLNVYVRALESTGRAKVLARPFVFTANNKPAQISIGERVPVPASSQSSVVTGNTTTFNTNIEYEDVNLDIFVTPLINSKDEVTLTISETNDDILEFVSVGNQSAPRISQQNLDTEVAVPNGGIAVIGGLIRDKENASNASVPIIARIPILRNLFGSTKNQFTRRELLIFIQPRIVETADELTAMHSDHTRRTVLGKEAERFAQPDYNVEDVVLPTDSGDLPLQHAGTLLPQLPPEAAAPIDVSSKEPMVIEQTETSVQTGTLPYEKKRRQPFWEKPANPVPPAKPGTSLKKLLPWNWGKD